MDSAEFYSPDELCKDLESLMRLNPSKLDEKDRWLKRAGEITKRLSGYIDLDRSEFAGIDAFLENGSFMSRHAAYYEAEIAGVRARIGQYRDSL
jgi:hypothetical protein